MQGVGGECSANSGGPYKKNGVGGGGGGRGGIGGGAPIKKMGVQFFSFLLFFPPFPSHLQLLDAKMTCPCVLWWGGGGVTVL